MKIVYALIGINSFAFTFYFFYNFCRFHVEIMNIFFVKSSYC
jgi:hypothetical protein